MSAGLEQESAHSSANSAPPLSSGGWKSLSLKSLPHEDALMALSALSFIEGELGRPLRRQKLLVAFSGGVDSTALLVLFCALRQRQELKIFAAHLDHGLRVESAQDAEAAAGLCRALDVPFLARRTPVSALAKQLGCGLEEGGRRARHAFLEECRMKTGASWVMTGHHCGDLAEDVLMRLVRGAGWPALGGMKAVVETPDARVLRPLLMLEKKRLAAMLTRMGIAWREDATNASTAWRRNRMRNAVVPLLLQENPNFFDCVRRLWSMARKDEKAWSTTLNEAFMTYEDGSMLISAEVLQALTEEKRMRLYHEAVGRMGAGQSRAGTIAAMDKAWLARRFPRLFQFGGGLRAGVSAKGILFQAKQADQDAATE